MAEIVAHFTNQGVPLVSPANAPTIRIRRTDTGALVVTDANMTELGDGLFVYTFAPAATLEYSIRCDGDPTVAGQTTAQERYQFAALSGITDARIETDIPEILTDTAAIAGLPAAIDATLSAAHGSGAWDGTEADWTATEREQIRGALGIVGTQATPAGGGHLQDIRTPVVVFLDAAITGIPAAVDVALSAAHGAGSWQLGSKYESYITDIWRRLHLDPANPRVDTPTSIKVPADGSLIDIAISVVGDTVTGQRS